MRTLVIAICIAVAGCAPAVTRTTEDVRPRAAILVTTQQTCPAHADGCDIVAILDLHTTAASEDKGFDELRGLAAARGGDAVLGAEFEHGRDGEPSHLSGLIVKYSERVPPHVEIGEVEVASDPDDQRKGLEELVTRAAAMGGDQVIGVTFEHGEDGARGRLRGRVIRFSR
jgi:uncharacterized protein YbjQ (UPF0145 family)